MLALEQGHHLAADQDPRKPGEEIGDLVRDTPETPLRVVVRNDEDRIFHQRWYRLNRPAAAS